MKETRLLMGMPVSLEVVDAQVTQADFDEIYAYLTYIDETFSTYKETSEISKINAGELAPELWSADMQEVMAACAQTKRETDGFFEISQDGKLDPSGYVKGWAIQGAANLLKKKGFTNFYVDAGGDLQVSGHNAEGNPWVIGIRNPFNQQEIVKRVALENKGMATSGTYIRGQHIYNPHDTDQEITEIVSLSVIGESITDADRFATAAFAMGRAGIEFIAGLAGFEGYQIDQAGIATFTPGFTNYVI